jgi:hypothetical protein
MLERVGHIIYCGKVVNTHRTIMCSLEELLLYGEVPLAECWAIDNNDPPNVSTPVHGLSHSLILRMVGVVTVLVHTGRVLCTYQYLMKRAEVGISSFEKGGKQAGRRIPSLLPWTIFTSFTLII